jgi:hypothetical protein
VGTRARFGLEGQVYHEPNTCQEIDYIIIIIFKNSSNIWMNFFHPSMIFYMPYLPHMGSHFDYFFVIRFVLASFTQQ